MCVCVRLCNGRYISFSVMVVHRGFIFIIVTPTAKVPVTSIYAVLEQY